MATIQQRTEAQRWIRMPKTQIVDERGKNAISLGLSSENWAVRRAEPSRWIAEWFQSMRTIRRRRRPRCDRCPRIEGRWVVIRQQVCDYEMLSVLVLQHPMPEGERLIVFIVYFFLFIRSTNHPKPQPPPPVLCSSSSSLHSGLSTTPKYTNTPHHNQQRPIYVCECLYFCNELNPNYTTTQHSWFICEISPYTNLPTNQSTTWNCQDPD